ncbi:hypothetical protein OG357_23305 [Streptomyces sp. NBC_01255]|uniref:hypothetical protein n=1 Tax=Streptomyces sp. NBC_01255 TaxID=2903798 RepID=UPI002E31258E|nr:hypothetical protein [Streptomyces sp. NBC_01255]
MRTPSDDTTSNGGELDRTPAGPRPGAGNAAAIELLRQAGHPWAQELHEHDAGCDHGPNEQTAAPDAGT